MQNLLFLVHRIPYPPNKGDKIRSFHFLRELSKHFNVFLGTFIDDEEDWEYCDTLKLYCSDAFCLALKPQTAKLKSLFGFLNGQALSLPFYRNGQMQQWVDRTITDHAIEKVLIFSSVMAQYVLNKPKMEIFADFVDVDSDKWGQYAKRKPWPESWIYQRESRQLLRFEKCVAKQAKASIFVSQQEAELFKQLAPEAWCSVTAVNNGVDVERFDPKKTFKNPYRNGEQPIVFIGAMDYWANVDAVVWFAEAVFPQIRRRFPQSRFYIVGAKPTKEVLALADLPNIIVTGRVEDIRYYLFHAWIAVAPLRIARGIQNKVLEAMAMGKMLVATTAAMEGIADDQALDVLVADEAEQFAELTCRLLAQPPDCLTSPKNRTYVELLFSWQHSGERLIQLISS